MLTGKELGAAIKDAIEKKGVRQNELARHFGIKPPSVQDWIKKGTIGKDKLPELWAYFSDVVGPEHWGLAEFPHGNFKVAARPEEPTQARQVTESQWAMLEDFNMLPDDEKAALRNTLKSKADHMRKVVDEYLGKLGITAKPATDARVEETFGAPPPPPIHGYQKITKIPKAPKPGEKAKGR